MVADTGLMAKLKETPDSRPPFDVPSDFPSAGEVLAAIPADCFKRSLPKSLFYASISIFLTLGAAVAAYHVLPTPTLAAPLGLAGWAAYAVLNGIFATGVWVAAHECGHGAFCDNKFVQDACGYVMHSVLLVPYFSWQRSHAVHHSRTNHMTEGETHVPDIAAEEGRYKIRLHEVLGDDAFALLNLFNHLVLGWPAYLLTGATGAPSRGFTNHFVPTSDSLFPGEWKRKVLLSDVGVVATLAALYQFSRYYGTPYTLALYWGPYLCVNSWLVLYTWLQHTDVDIPHYDDKHWNWVKGAFSTVDRPYPEPIDFLHHRIGSTHVAHHICSKIPHYNARRATEAIKQTFPQYYLYDPTPIVPATWRVAQKCVAVTTMGDRYVYCTSKSS